MVDLRSTNKQTEVKKMFWEDDMFEEFRKMREEMNMMANRMNNAFGPKMLAHGEQKDLAKYRAPTSDIKETENNVIATFEIPGADKDDIELNVTENAVEVKVEKKGEKEIKKKGEYSYSAFSHSFYRALPLPAEVDAGKANAEYKNGVLTVEMPKLKKIEAKKKKISIK